MTGNEGDGPGPHGGAPATAL